MNVFVYEAVSAGALGDEAAPSLRTEGWAMLAAIVEDLLRRGGLSIHTLLAKSVRQSLGHSCRHIAKDEEPSAFLDMVRRCDAVLVIAPECDGLLEERSRQVTLARKVLLGSDPEAIHLTGDKQALATHWHRHGVTTPALLAPGRESFPLVCKPRHGAGSQAVFRVERADEMDGWLCRARADMFGDDILVQTWVAGQAVSVSFLIGPSQTLALAPAYQLISDDGRCRYLGGVLPLPEPLAARAVALGKAAIACVPGLRGFVGVDLILGKDTDWAIEINPRLTTSYIGLRQLATTNLAQLWWQMALGETIAPPTWRAESVRFSPDGTFSREPAASAALRW